MTPEQKAWIDSASYEDLLRRWRFAELGDPMFTEGGEYYRDRMNDLGNEMTNEEKIAASKRIGWNSR
jgi:hypothetical protein